MRRRRVNTLLLIWLGGMLGATLGGWQWVLAVFLGWPALVLVGSVAIIYGGLLWQWAERRHVIDPSWRRFTRGDWQ